MRYTRLIMNATIKNNFRWRTAVYIIFGVVMLCVIGVAALFITQYIYPEVNESSPDHNILENYLGLTLFATSFCTVGIYSSIFSAQSLIREKTRGNIQALLATPISPGDICMGKTLAIFLPGFLFGFVIVIIMLLLINLVYLVPTTGFIITPWMIISSFIAVPLVFFTLTMFVHLIGMTGKASTGNIIARLSLSILPALMIILAMQDVSNAGSWLFMVILLLIAGVIGIYVMITFPKLTTESIILSQ